jgi:hypothetical protein
MALVPGARTFLIQTVIFGLAGKIEVDGAAIIGVMPSFASLPDADLASVLNYSVGLAGASARKIRPITADEVAAVRNGPRLSAAQVREHRAQLAAAGHIP